MLLLFQFPLVCEFLGQKRKEGLAEVRHPKREDFLILFPTFSGLFFSSPTANNHKHRSGPHHPVLRSSDLFLESKMKRKNKNKRKKIRRNQQKTPFAHRTRSPSNRNFSMIMTMQGGAQGTENMIVLDLNENIKKW